TRSLSSPYGIDFMHHHNGSCIMFGDMNAVRNEQKRVGYIFNNIEADYFNSFIDATGLVDLPIGGRCFTWMNKAGNKLNKLDRFLILKDVIDLLPNIRITALDRMWSNHNPILLHVDKIDFGPSPFKLYNAWLLRDGFNDLIKSEWDSLDSNNFGFPIKCHEKFRILNDKIRQWYNNNNNMERNRKATALKELSSIEKKIDKGSASPFDTGNHLNLLHELEIIDKIVSMDLIQKARVRWDIEGDENTKFFHGLINQKRQNQMLNAFDSISWNYLDHILDSLEFGLKWRSWIKTFLSSSRAFILVNGSPTSEFSINRGLRQGDPLSPFLFIIVMEGLLNAFVDAVGNGLINGININNSSINISYFFADDVIITTGWNARDLENIIRVLHVFYLASGLKINIHKSNIYGIGVNEDEVYNMASNAGCIIGNIPFNYLGLPIGSNMKSIASWKMLIDRFRSRLSTWKASLLSIGGHLTLIKSVLGSLGIYYLLIFRAPESVLNDLERIWSNFFWGGNQDGKKMAWVRWTIILNSYDNEGLNIGSLKDFNLALLQKWRWSFKGTWANIVGSLNFLHSKGPSLYQDQYWCSKSCFFRDMLNDIGQLNIVASEDTCVWNLSPNDTFTVKDARNIIDRKTLPFLPSTSWDKIIPRKVNIFMWRLSLDRLPHRLNLSLRGMDIPVISCSSCNANVESANYIFFECIIASDLWKLVYRWCEIHFVQALSFEAFKDWLSSWHATKEKKHKLVIISTSVLWWLWRF
ncbi:RNA-directed DNA polymerase, eukaryota, reverse transcriptase zinc-binding domain protein, partial [Tanacetum coccineum]